MTASVRYFAPFGPRGSHPVDQDLATRLLGIALGRGGDYADLFFEYTAEGGLSFEEGITRSASRGVRLGLGVRVRQGDATGYANHADYVFGWKGDALQRLMDTPCVVNCPAANPKTQNNAAMNKCVQKVVVDEPVDGCKSLVFCIF